ncbi:MAG TPA: DUF1592 domain-containing protein [Polyangia bacterium]|nr:DUF1592 domain-containing protein [Polyangia bacterium]
MFAGLTACQGTVGGSGSGTGNAGNGGPGNAGNGGPGNAGNTGSAGNTSTGSAGNTGSSGATGTGGTGGSGYVPSITCSPGIPATTQMRRMQNWQYDAVVRDLLGVTTVGTGATAQPPSGMLYADFDGPMVPDAWRIYNDVGSAIAKAVMANATQKAKFISCDPGAAGTAGQTCLKNTITTFGRKAFRRPLTDAEVTRFLQIGMGTTPAPTAAEVSEATLYAFLVSPSFLTIPEISTTTPSGSGYQLSQYEVAARLSFLIWGSIPDDMLNTAADMNQLQTKDQILMQASRMLAVRDKSTPLVQLFHRQWVQMNNGNAHWWNGDHDTTKFPLYNTTTSKTSYGQEIDNFFAEVVFTNGGYKDLFLSPVGFINKDNAGIYGMTNTGTTLTKVNLDPVQRPGFMTRAGFLASYSHYDMTAPILRGAFITIFMIGVDPGPPAPGATMIQPPAGNYPTVRDRTDALVNQGASCMGCHTNVINPPGYVMENYDAIGAWQTVDKLGNGAINPVATVNFGDGNTKQISNAQQLMTELANIQKGRDMYSQNWVSFGYQRAPNPNDQCVADGISTKLGTGGAIINVLTDLTQADSFRVRVQAP